MNQKFEELNEEHLAEVLRKFYGTVRQKNGNEYSKSGMINLRSGINRYLHAPPYKKSFDLMNDRVFTQANLVFSGRLRDNKDKGLDVSAPRIALDKEDLEKLFNEYFPKAAGDDLNTEVLLHKIFFDIMYYTGRRGKEGLRSLDKNSFVVKSGGDGMEFIEITFNEKTKKNQGDTLSVAANALHNDHHVITSIPNSNLCPIDTFKCYVDLLHPENQAFFQKPNKSKTGFTKELLGKNTLGDMMKTISKAAKLSRIYTNHQIRKTTATGMKRSGFSLEQIANVTKHKNLDSLKHYLNAPTLEEKHNYNEGLFNYGSNRGTAPSPLKRKDANQQEDTTSKKQKLQENENLNNNNNVVAVHEDQPNAIVHNTPQVTQSVVTNQLRQASNLFQNATFSNCNFTFSMPQ